MLRGDLIKWHTDSSTNDDGFRLCVNGIPANAVTCVASSDPTQTTVDPMTGEFFCVDGDISGDTNTGCTCTPKACIIQSPMTEACLLYTSDAADDTPV